MICPHCKEVVLHSQIVKRNIKGFDHVDIAYDAVCPFCNELIGRMFWGKLVVRDQSTPATVLKREPEKEQPVLRSCPHCGGLLPEDPGSLPPFQDRRRREERRVTERRQMQLSLGEMERRKGDRRRRSERRRVPLEKEEDS